MPTTIWTIGHSNHPLEVFLDLLVQHGIDAVVDVRSSPYSRYVSHFNREAIHAALVQRAIQYVFLGDLLGGRVDDPRFYDGEGRVLYGEVAQSPGFRQGIQRLLGIAEQTRTASEDRPLYLLRPPITLHPLPLSQRARGVRFQNTGPICCRRICFSRRSVSAIRASSAASSAAS